MKYLQLNQVHDIFMCTTNGAALIINKKTKMSENILSNVRVRKNDITNKIKHPFKLLNCKIVM